MPSSENGPCLLTVGHGAASEEALAAALTSAGVTALVDVRRFPGSRAHPHVARQALERWLPQHGVAYRWEPRLGGRRRLPPGAASADGWWTVAAFRAYAAHTRTEEFGLAMTELLEGARARTTAVMCSETLWWRCHRRLVADVAALAHGADVRHLLPDALPRPHPVAPGARLRPDGAVVWDGVGEE